MESIYIILECLLEHIVRIVLYKRSTTHVLCYCLHSGEGLGVLGDKAFKLVKLIGRADVDGTETGTTETDHGAANLNARGHGTNVHVLHEIARL